MFNLNRYFQFILQNDYNYPNEFDNLTNGINRLANFT